jgi:hypothetical protein
MNSEEIYTVLLNQPRAIDGKTWHGFSYQLSRSEEGAVTVNEIGWPTKLTIYEADGPELDALDDATFKSSIESALPVDEGYVIPPPPVPFVETFTAEQVVAKYFSPYQTLALQRFEMALLQAGKPLGPKMTACKQYLESVMLGWALDPTPKESFGSPAATFEEASAEAVTDLAG